MVSDGYGVTDELSHGFFEANNGIGDFLAALKDVIPITTLLGFNSDSQKWHMDTRIIQLTLAEAFAFI